MNPYDEKKFDEWLEKRNAEIYALEQHDTFAFELGAHSTRLYFLDYFNKMKARLDSLELALERVADALNKTCHVIPTKIKVMDSSGEIVNTIDQDANYLAEGEYE